MILLALVVLVALAAAAALGGPGLVSPGRLRLAAIPVVVGGMVVVLLLAVVVVGGLRSASHDEPGGSAGARAPVTTTTPTVSAPTRARPPATIPPGPELPFVAVVAAEDGRLSPYPVVDGMRPEGVVRVVATGFDAFESGVAAQCVVGPGADEVCGRRSPVRFDEDGRAEFQVLVTDTVESGRCRVGRPTCLFRVTGSSSGRQGTVQTVFVDRAARATVTLAPAAEKGRGYEVRMAVTGLDPGAEGVAVVCGPQDSFLGRGCADARTTFVVGADGAGAATVAVGTAGVGVDRVRCGPRRDCGVWVFADDGYLVASAAPIRFPAGASASYNSRRLATGLGLALALAVVAVLVAVTTDWTKPTEAFAPSLEHADLQESASLDDLFGTEAELDERDPIPG